MKRYANLNGNSSVSEYEIGDDFIRVKFQDRDVYRYTNFKPGSRHVEEMKGLAQKGSGLATYINKNVRKNYETKET